MSSGRANRSIPFVDIIGASVRTDLKIESRRRRSSNISIPSAKQSRIPSETDSHTATPSGESYRNSQLDTSVAQGSTFATEHGSDVSSDAGMSRRQRRGSFFTIEIYSIAGQLGYAFTVHTRRKNLELELGDELLMKRLVDGSIYLRAKCVWVLQFGTRRVHGGYRQTVAVGDLDPSVE